MRKWFLVILSVLVLAVPMSAQVDSGTLTGLADVYPADSTLVFLSVRTDDAFFDTLDSAFAPLFPILELPEDFSIRDALNESIRGEVPVWSWDDTFRPLLGDTAAIGLFMPSDILADPMQYDIEEPFDDLEAILAVEIRDRAGVEALLAQIGTAQGVDLTPEQRGGYAVYALPDEGFLALSDSVMFFTEYSALLDSTGILTGDFVALSAHDDLNTTIGLLPNGDGYNALFYFNQPSYAATVNGMAASLGDTLPEDAQSFLTVVNNIGSVAFAAVILDGRSFTIDSVMGTADLSPLGLSMPSLGALNPLAAQRIPNAPLMIQSTNLAGAYDFGVDFVKAVAVLDDPEAAEDIDGALALGNIVLRGSTGLAIDDLFSWVTSDYALLLGYNPSIEGATSVMDLMAENPLDLAFVADASVNPDAALAVVDGVEMFVTGEFVASINEQDDAEVNITSSRDGDVLTVTATSLTGEVPFPLELMVGVANDVFFIATPPTGMAVRDGLAGVGAQAAYQSATTWTLADSSAVYYVDFNQFTPLLDLAMMLNPDDSDLADLQQVLPLLDTATISWLIDDSGVSRSRWVVTLK